MGLDLKPRGEHEGIGLRVGTTSEHLQTGVLFLPTLCRYIDFPLPGMYVLSSRYERDLDTRIGSLNPILPFCGPVDLHAGILADLRTSVVHEQAMRNLELIVLGYNRDLSIDQQVHAIGIFSLIGGNRRTSC